MLTRLLYHRAWICAVCFAFASVCLPAGAETSDRPTVGLVLSGGGARGAAHVGILRYFEEQQIPVDYVAGTSFGALVGGLYAAGFSVEEIDLLLRTSDWNYLLSQSSPRDEMPIRRKIEDRDFLIRHGLRISSTGELILPQSFIPNQKISTLLRQVLSTVQTPRDFDELPIPFACVTTDFAAGEPYVLRGGALDRAILASMAVPGVFPPVEIDGRLLVDGGMVNNVPVDVVREWGPDVIIVVDIGSELLSKEEIRSYLNTIDQTFRLMVRKNAAETIAGLRESEILIQPELGEFGSGSFDEAFKAIDIGYAAARDAAGRLEHLELGDAQWAEYTATHRRPLRLGTPVISAVVVDNESRLNDAIVETKIRQVPGEPLDAEQLRSDLGRVQATGFFDSVDFSLIPSEDGETQILRVHTVGRKHPSWNVQGGMRLESNFSGQSSFIIGIQQRLEEINAFGGEWQTRLEFGDRTLLSTSFYQPVSPAQTFFVLPELKYLEYNTNLYSDGRILEQLRLTTASVSLGGGYMWRNNFVFAARYEIGDSQVKDEIGLLPIDESITYAQLGFVAYYDTLDNINFPESGLLASIQFDLGRAFLGGDVDFDILSGEIQKPFAFGPHIVTFKAKGATALDDQSPLSEIVPLGGFLNLSGFNFEEISGRHMAFGEIIYTYRLFEPSFSKPLVASIYVGGSAEWGNVFADSSDVEFDAMIFSGSVFLGMDTVLGPLYFAYGRAETGRDSFYFYLGRPY